MTLSPWPKKKKDKARVMACLQDALQWSCPLVFKPLRTLPLYHTRVGLCNLQSLTEEMVWPLQDGVMKNTMASVLLFLSLHLFLPPLFSSPSVSQIICCRGSQLAGEAHVVRNHVSELRVDLPAHSSLQMMAAPADTLTAASRA